MKIKKEYIALVVIIIGLSLYLVTRSPDRTSYELPEFSEIAKKDISKLEISKLDASILLKKADDKWHFDPEGYLANPDRVENMLNVIQDLTMTALVSESKNYSLYNLDEEHKIAVRAWAGDRLTREFAVGKVATSYRHTFVKLAGDDRVYHAKGNFRSQFDQTADRLRDKTVLSFDQSKIQEIQITKGTEVITLGRTEVPVKMSAGQESDVEPAPSPEVEPVWQTADGKKGDTAQLEKLITILSDLKCETYIDDFEKEDLADPIYTLQLKGIQDYTLSVFAKMEKDVKHYPAVSSENDYAFLLPEWQVDSLMKNPGEILKKPANCQSPEPKQE
jgi:hypothetical protein